jgi:hypothetical protein
MLRRSGVSKLILVFVPFAFLVLQSWRVESKDLDYRLVLTAGTGIVDGQVVRYLTMFEDACLTVQNVVPGDVGKVAVEKRLCNLEGKNIATEFVDVKFKRGVFTDEGLFFEVSATPFRPLGERKLYCQVKFANGVAEQLSCEDRYSD